MRNRLVAAIVMAMFTLALAACSRAEAPPPASHGAHGKVHFVQPKNGATIKTMSTFEFGGDGVKIGAVPAGTITPEQVRPGITHYHLGVDTDCLPTGVAIPKADPWIHFGDGKNVIEMSLKPGPHRLVLQSGDDLHRTVEGLCETINVTVVE
jgi:uncharacterized protein DUF4399